MNESHAFPSNSSLAKHKSIQVLTNKLRKCNIPCQIYRRLGKCSAQLKGKCPRLHDPKHVIICPRFLKGECTLAAGCLLSHDVSLEKMPVCRFFLEGRCVKNDCPYLHKKVSETERICEDFLRGYCPLAAKVITQRSQRHPCSGLSNFSLFLSSANAATSLSVRSTIDWGCAIGPSVPTRTAVGAR